MGTLHPRARALVATLAWPTFLGWGRALMLEHRLFTLHHVNQLNKCHLVTESLRNWHQDTANQATAQRRDQRLRSPKFLTLLAQAEVPRDLARHVTRVFNASEDLSAAVLAVAAVMGGDALLTAQLAQTAILRAMQLADGDVDLGKAVHRGIQFGDVAGTMVTCTRILQAAATQAAERGIKGKGTRSADSAPNRS